jgi:hypothetical protein
VRISILSKKVALVVDEEWSVMEKGNVMRKQRTNTKSVENEGVGRKRERVVMVRHSTRSKRMSG